MSAQSLTGLAPRACEVCEQRDKLFRCSRCQITYYCSGEHQEFDLSDHKHKCRAIKAVRCRLERGEKRLRELPGDPFATEVGRFGLSDETGTYMLLRYALVDELLDRFGGPGARVDAVQLALDHSLEMQRLGRAENLGVSDLIPALYIRLGRDQEAYDFVKWYANAGADPFYNWRNTELPFLDVKNADVFEALEEEWTREDYIESHHVIAVALIKIKVLRDLQAIQNARRALQGTLPLPTEIIDLIREQMVGSIVGSRPKLFSAPVEEIASLIDNIKGQVKQLFRTISFHLPDFWELMIDDGETVLQIPKPWGYRQGSFQHCSLLAGYFYASWAETPGAIPAMEALRDHVGNQPFFKI